MGWVYLLSAIILELGGTFSMKESDGFNRIWPSVFVFIFYGLCLIALTLAMKKLEVSVVYSSWAGLGTAAVSLIGILYYKEPISVSKFMFLGIIIVGVAGLNWVSRPLN